MLEALRAAMGSHAFAAQYQQDPVPAVGNVIRKEWFKSFDLAKFERTPGTVIQSWDTASKDNPHNDWSVCITAVLRRSDLYIINVVRKRMQIPELRARAIALANEYRPTTLLIEDQASGQQLIQLLRTEKHGPASSPIGRRPEGDKVSRALGVSAMIEAGRVHLPDDAPWLAEFTAELLGFPNSRFDDQVDALSQLLGWVRQNDMYHELPICGPIIVYADGDGRSVWSDEETRMPYRAVNDPWL